MVSAEHIRELTKQTEGTTLEFKSCTDKVSPTVYESICAFLNREGGELLIGVSNEGEILGVNRKCVEAMIKNIINTLNNPQFFVPVAFLFPEVVEVEDKFVLYINVPESPQVHRYKGQVFDRNGDADNDITRSFYLIDNLHLRKRKTSSESEVLPALTLDDFDRETFKKMRSHIAIFNPQHNWLEMDDATILRTFFWRKDPLSNQEGYILAALLLFGKENSILLHCPYHRTDAIYRNMTYARYLNPLPTDPDIRYDDRDLICENLIESYSRLMNFVNRNLPDKFRLDEQNINRIDVRNLIFREVTANLLIHREFSHSFASKFLIFSDRVITENWTKPMQFGNITLDNWESHTKNPLIAKVFREMKWVEELGSGKKNIKKYAPLYYDDYRIEIENNDKFVFSITYRDADESENGIESGLSQQQVGDKSATSQRQVGDKSNLEMKEKILQICVNAKTRNEILSAVNLKDRDKFMKNYIKPLIEESLLAMTVPDKPNSRFQKYYTTENGMALIE
ncbi:ATP-dependent DNA helicase RecG [Bacteroidia bacterium]|nr:ATP-dependent DNA helicase RecG [Bacteroidia bacterium]